MTLAFSTELNGKKTFFPQKIIKGLPYEKWSISAAYSMVNDICKECGYVKSYEDLKPKLHTIRRDEKNRWKAGNNIHFVINNRTANRFQFFSVVKCISTQIIEIKVVDEIRKYYSYVSELKFNDEVYRKCFDVTVDNCLLNRKEVETLSINDGFDTVEEFFNYFSEDFRGKIIHWTPLKY